MRFVSGWRLALRLAVREAGRAKARTALVLAMVTLPLVAVIAADVARATSSVSPIEGLDRRLGSAQARVVPLPDSGPIYQSPDPDGGGYGAQPASHRPPTAWHDIAAVLGGDRPVTELRRRVATVRTGLGGLQVDALGVDLSSPLTAGLVRLTAGRLPRATHEVTVNAALASHGFRVGSRLALTDGTTATVVGIAESTSERTSPFLTAPPAFFPAARGPSEIASFLVGGAPVTWTQVRALNQLGVLVLSRHVVEHPPSLQQLPPQLRGEAAAGRGSLYTVLILVAVMALIEVVLLAGPAFAVGARRQSRSLALISANGGTPTQSRRVVLGSALVVGAVAALVGVVLGIGLAKVALLPFLQARSDSWFGPFQVHWSHLAAIAVLGLLSAFLAAVVPAWIASRQDVVAVLAGRRGDRAASRRSPVAGVVLVGLGVALAVLGARRDAGETLIAGAAVVTVLGMVLLVPLVVVVVSRLGRRLPLPLRYAVRDAARHRTRTVPAIAAVAATVAGAVALSIGNTSDQAQAKADYSPVLPAGMSQVYLNERHPDWAGVTAAVHGVVPGERVLAMPTVGQTSRFDVGTPRGVELPDGAGGAAVDDGHDPAVDALLTAYLGAPARARIDAKLRAGHAVAFAAAPTTSHEIKVAVGRSGHRVRVDYVASTKGQLPELLLPTATARSLGLTPATGSLLLAGPTLTKGQESDLRQVLTGLSQSSDLYVERGYVVPSSERIVLWILFGLAAVLMLGGTLTATFLALSDARPDLATLSAVGASPRMRRAVAAAYAVSVGGVGALLGAAVGFVPGIAVSYPLTRSYVGAPGPSHYLVIPWPQIVALVVLLPLVTAAVVGLVARSRLPLVARLD